MTSTAVKVVDGRWRPFADFSSGSYSNAYCQHFDAG